jgi:predicted Zn-dependent peptidase
MMFNGAKKYGPKIFDRIMENSGGASNAYTTENVTVYQDWVPTSAIEQIFATEADRIGSLILDEKMVDKECVFLKDWLYKEKRRWDITTTMNGLHR